MTDLPLACKLSSAELRRHREGLLPGLVARAEKRITLKDGYRWHFAAGADLLADITSVIQAERRCCPFLRFVVATEPDMGPVSLEVTGPPGARDFLDQLAGPTAA